MTYIRISSSTTILTIRRAARLRAEGLEVWAKGFRGNADNGPLHPKPGCLGLRGFTGSSPRILFMRVTPSQKREYAWLFRNTWSRIADSQPPSPSPPPPPAQTKKKTLQHKRGGGGGGKRLCFLLGPFRRPSSGGFEGLEFRV